MASSKPTNEQFCICPEQCECRTACQFEIGTCQHDCKKKRDRAKQQQQLQRQQLQQQQQQQQQQHVTELKVPKLRGTGSKDPYPLAFFDDPSQAQSPAPELSEDRAPLIYGPSFYTNTTPIRKPVPVRRPAISSPPSFSEALVVPSKGVIVTPSSSNLNESEESTTPTSEPPQDLIAPAPRRPTPETQSFIAKPLPPVPPSRHRRTAKLIAKNVFAQSCSTSTDEDEMKPPTNEFAAWPTSHLESGPNAASYFPRAPTPPIRHSSPARVSTPQKAWFSRANLDKPQPPTPLPLPDFIAPRPAKVQRYVSAGGNTPLRDRPEITGFALPPRVETGVSMHMDEMMQRLQEVQRRASSNDSSDNSGGGGGNSSVATMSTRPSHENAYLGRTSGGSGSENQNNSVSDAGDDDIRGDAGKRKHSGTGFREGLKRIFSRQNSQADQ